MKVFLSIIIVFFLGACTKNELKDIELNDNPFDPQSGMDGIVIDSAYAITSSGYSVIKVYFHITSSSIDTSNIAWVRFFRDGMVWKKAKFNSQDHLIDMDVIPGTSYYYSIALEDFNGKLSVESKSISVVAK